MGTALNRDTTIEINTNPGGTASYSRIATGISNKDTNGNEVVSQNTFDDGDGHGSSTVTGKQTIIALTGERRLDDVSQNYIADLIDILGDARLTDIKKWDANGQLVECPITIANIIIEGGASGDAAVFSAELHFNGAPDTTPPVPASALTATIVLTDGLVTITATPDAGNELRYSVTGAAASTPNAMTVSLNSRTYKGPFAATAGKYVNVYECKYGTRIIKFKTSVLV